MNTRRRQLLPTIVLPVLALAWMPGPVTAEILSQSTLVEGPIARPAHIWVYPFASTAAEVPPESALKDLPHEDAAEQTPEHLAEGRKLGELMATALAADVAKMGMPASCLVAGSKQQVNDLVFRGYLLSFEEGDEKKRVLIGLGKGEAELKVAVEGFQVTTNGLRKLGTGSVDSHSSKTPGTAVGAATMLATSNPVGLIVSTGMKVHGEKTGSSSVEGQAQSTAKEIAGVLQKRFEEQGWITAPKKKFLGRLRDR